MNHPLTSTAPPVEDPAAAVPIQFPSGAALGLPAWVVPQRMEEEEKSHKKKYAKESWPGKRPSHLLV